VHDRVGESALVLIRGPVHAAPGRPQRGKLPGAVRARRIDTVGVLLVHRTGRLRPAHPLQAAEPTASEVHRSVVRSANGLN